MTCTVIHSLHMPSIGLAIDIRQSSSSIAWGVPAGHESFYDPLPPGSGLYPAKRKEAPKNTTSQLQQKGSLHPVKDKQKQKSLDAAAYLGDAILL